MSCHENDIENLSEFYTFYLASKNLNLHRNMSLIFYFSKNEKDNLDEMLRTNTIRR